jgi:hypothetical protein
VWAWATLGENYSSINIETKGQERGMKGGSLSQFTVSWVDQGIAILPSTTSVGQRRFVRDGDGLLLLFSMP